MKYYSVERSTDHLAHYGVKGMKWGVRKAISSKNDKALYKHYRKAAKKLKKLQDIGINPKKYAKKAIAYGTAAAGTGTIVAGKGVSSKIYNKIGGDILAKRFIEKAGEHVSNVAVTASKYNNDAGLKMGLRGLSMQVSPNAYLPMVKKAAKISGMTVAAGLGVKAAQNAYRAANAKKYRKKAVEWKQQMDNAFQGTKYENHYEIPRKRRRKSR